MVTKQPLYRTGIWYAAGIAKSNVIPVALLIITPDPKRSPEMCDTPPPTLFAALNVEALSMVLFGLQMCAKCLGPTAPSSIRKELFPTMFAPHGAEPAIKHVTPSTRPGALLIS